MGGESYTGHTEGPFEFFVFLNLMGLVDCLNQLLAEKIAVLQAGLTQFYSCLRAEQFREDCSPEHTVVDFDCGKERSSDSRFSSHVIFLS